MSAPQSVHTRPFRNKMIYLGCIIALIFPIYMLSQPASETSVGGFLEHQRNEAVDIKDLGEINMAAETMRLGTFGMDGIAQMMLWQKADEYKKKKEWTKLAATLNQLIVLNPHLETVWRFQGWNLAYNISVEQDNYNDRYFWVKKGMSFLERGTKYNPRAIRLTWDVGWTTSQKINKSDERDFFRKLYRNDPDVTDVPGAHDAAGFQVGKRDGWLVGKWWYKKAEALHDVEGVDLQTSVRRCFILTHRSLRVTVRITSNGTETLFMRTVRPVLPAVPRKGLRRPGTVLTRNGWNSENALSIRRSENR